MPEGSSRVDARRNRRAILDAAVQVLLGNRGASMQEVADAAGVSRATLHRHYTNRDALIRAIAFDAIAEARTAVVACRLDDGPVWTALERLVRTFLPIGDRFALVFAEWHLERDAEVMAGDAEVSAPIEALLARGQRDGSLRPDVPGAWLAISLYALLVGAWEGIRDGRLAPADAPGLVLTTLRSGWTPPSPVSPPNADT